MVGVALLSLQAFAVHAAAQPTQEEVFKRIGESVSEPVDPSRALAVAAGIAGAAIVLAAVGHRRKREPKSRSLNHPAKLLKEVLRNVPLRRAEVKQVKALAHEFRPPDGDRVDSLLTLLLCPSLLVDAAKQSRGKADLDVVAGLAKRLAGK